MLFPLLIKLNLTGCIHTSPSVLLTNREGGEESHRPKRRGGSTRIHLQGLQLIQFLLFVMETQSLQFN